MLKTVLPSKIKTKEKPGSAKPITKHLELEDRQSTHNATKSAQISDYIWWLSLSSSKQVKSSK